MSLQWAGKDWYSSLTRQEVALAYEVAYLILRRPGARGILGIGVLVIALTAGGALTANLSHVFETQPSQAARAPQIAPHIPPTPAISRQHSESAALSYVLDASLELAEHVAHAVRPPEAVTAPVPSLVTHYGESYNGQVLGCGTGYYSSDNPTIVAVSPALYGAMPCGTLLEICGEGGCIVAMRQDACPGCSASLFDLSEAAFAAVCGVPSGVCSATVSVVETCATMDLSWRDRPEPPVRERTPWDDWAEAPMLGLAIVELEADPAVEATIDAAARAAAPGCQTP